MAKPRLIADCTKELLDNFHAKARRNKMTMGEALIWLANRWLAEDASANSDKYRVTLPVVIDGVPRVPGDVISLPLETAKEYSHALIGVEGTAGNAANVTELAPGQTVVPCTEEEAPWLIKLVRLLRRGTERNRIGIEENLDWAVGNLERQSGRPRKRA